MPGVIAIEGNLVVADFGGPGPLLNKKQLAARYGRSVRWVEGKVSEGMPSSLDERGRRRFRLSDVEDWLAGQRREANA